MKSNDDVDEEVDEADEVEDVFDLVLGSGDVGEDDCGDIDAVSNISGISLLLILQLFTSNTLLGVLARSFMLMLFMYPLLLDVNLALNWLCLPITRLLSLFKFLNDVGEVDEETGADETDEGAELEDNE